MAPAIVVPRRAIDLTGKRVGRLTVLSYSGRVNGFARWLCRCDCGTERLFWRTQLCPGRTQSCGCLRVESFVARNTKHGACDTPEYDAWKNMLARCYNKNGQEYRNYGGRGIVVCDRWRESFENFLADMGKRPGPKYSVERRKTNGNYSPENCYWATWREQSRNKRNNRLLTWAGETMTVTDWAERLGVSPGTIRSRIRYGWPVERIFTEPFRKRS